jgi:lambda repressor-like predicted transcriptional regulator
MSEKDFHVTVRVKNARLLRRMRAAGFSSAMSFAKVCGIQPTLLGELLAMKRSPLLKTNEWSHAAYSISAALHCEPEEIWPEHIARLKARDGSVSFEASLDEVQALTTPSPEHAVDTVGLQKLLSRLDPRERMIVEARYGIGGIGEATYEELRGDLNRSVERIRQIEAKAIRKMSRLVKPLKVECPV